MGGCASKKRRSDFCEDNERGFEEKIRLLREEVRGVVSQMDKEAKSHQKDMVVFAFKEATWKTEKKRLKEELKMLRKTLLQQKEDKDGDDNEKEWQLKNAIVEQIRKERADRDEAVEKWKQLYHAIKIELDHLIQRTHNGDGLYWGANDQRMEVLKMEIQAKEESIRGLKEELVSMKHDKYKRDREIDILRQSLRIMTSKKE